MKTQNKSQLISTFHKFQSNKGLTLIELLVAVVISALIIGAAIALHLSNQSLYVKEEVVTEVRNSVRGALDIIISDIREAGYNPTQAPPPEFDPAIRVGGSNWIGMRIDTSANGICEYGEERGYYIYQNKLYRMFCLTPCFDTVLVAENIDYLEFQYFDTNGDTLPRPVPATKLENIKAVKVIIVGKTPRQFSNHYESGTYPNGTTYSDRYYRCWDSTFVRLRNI